MNIENNTSYREVVACLVACFGSFALGTTIGYSSPAIPDMRTNDDANNGLHGMSEDQGSWVGSLMTVGAIFGGMLACKSIDKYGRRSSLLSFTGVFIIGWVLVIVSKNVQMMYFARVLTGFCAGHMSFGVPVYIAEIRTSSKNRTWLASCHSVAITLGILYVYGIGCILNWKLLAVAIVVILFIQLTTMPIMPETPRWFLDNEQHQEAVDSLQWVRGSTVDVAAEISMIEEAIREADVGGKVHLKDLVIKPSLRNPLIISLSLMFFQQFSGINAIMFYATDIFSAADSKLEAKFQTLIIGVVGVCGTIWAAKIMDMTGRRNILLISSIVMTSAMLAFGAYFYLKYDGNDMSNLQWLPVTCIVVFYLGNVVAFSRIPWVMIEEFFPVNAQYLATSVITTANWFFAFLVTKLFINMAQGTGNTAQSGIGYHGTYWLFAGVSAASILVVYYLVPETKGKTLEEIEESYLW